MIPSPPFMILALALALWSAPVSGQGSARLLPQTHARSIALHWKQDGRAIDLTIANPPGTWVVTAVSLEVRFKPIALSLAGSLKRDKSGRTVVVPPDPKAEAEEYWMEQELERPVLDVEIQPGKSLASHFEISSHADVASVVVLEARGREQSTIERLRSKLF